MSKKPASRRRPPKPVDTPAESADVQASVDAEAATGRLLVLAEPATPGELPDRVALLPLRSDVVFPQTVVPLVVNRPAGIKLIDEIMAEEKTLGLIAQRHPETDDPTIGDLYPTLCVGNVLKMLKFPDGSTRVVCQGMVRARLVELVQTEPFLVGRIEPLEDVIDEGVELDAQVHHVNRLFQRMIDQSQQVPEELQVAAMNTREPGRLADLLGSSLPFTIEEKQQLLAETNVRVRLEKLGGFLTRQLTVLELSSKIQAQVGSEITKAQRDHFLRQQIKAIQDELGESESDNPELDELWEKLEKAKPPADVLAEAEREMDRLAGMHPSSAEYSIVRTYLDWIAVLPWEKSSRDRLDLRRARKVLDADHYDLEKIKERILEYLAVRKLKKDMKGPILCFAGPPGTGKTSLGKSIAKALGREFVRISLGGVHDEAEIRGHRRTYVAAMPGRVIQGVRKSGTNNPVFMLDEVDKLGADFRGDPSAALLEVLDPEQNATFRDHYLDVDFDLSKVMFIATANMLETIPAPLLDRMEVIELPGYSEEEKVLIAKKYIVPKQLDAHGLTAKVVTFEDEAIRRIIADYTREAGLRNLEREVATVCRKVARKHAEGNKTARTIEAEGPARDARPAPVLPRGRRPDRHAGRRHRPGLDPHRRRDPLHRGLGDARQGDPDPDRPARRVDARERPGGPELPAEPRPGDGHRPGQDHQDRPPHPRPRRRGAQGRPLGRGGDLGRPDEPVPEPGDPPGDRHDRRGHAHRPGPARRRGPREGPGRPPGRDHDGPDPPPQREGPDRPARRGQGRRHLPLDRHPRRRDGPPVPDRPEAGTRLGQAQAQAQAAPGPRRRTGPQALPAQPGRPGQEACPARQADPRAPVGLIDRHSPPTAPARSSRPGLCDIRPWPITPWAA